MDAISIGKRIRQARLKAGLTQDVLGQRIGFSQVQVSAYERGDVTGVTIEVMDAIARATRHPLSFFIGEAPRIAVGLAEVLRQEHPDLDQQTISEIEAFVSWAVYRDHQKSNERMRQTDETSASDTEGTSGSRE